MATGKPRARPCKFKESNKVEVGVEPESPEFLIHKEQRFHGESGLHDGETDRQSRADRGIQDHG